MGSGRFLVVGRASVLEIIGGTGPSAGAGAETHDDAGIDGEKQYL